MKFILIGYFKQRVHCRTTRGVLKTEIYGQRLTHRACMGEASSYWWAPGKGCLVWLKYWTSFAILSARPVRQDTGQLAVPGNADQKSVTTGATARKKKSMGIRALSGKQRKDDHIKALLKEHLNEIQSILQPQKPVPVEVRGYKGSLYHLWVPCDVIILLPFKVCHRTVKLTFELREMLNANVPSQHCCDLRDDLHAVLRM